MHSDKINLQNDIEIIIKSADKGSGVGVWDKEDYLKEAASQLSDDNIYEKTVRKLPCRSKIQYLKVWTPNFKF